MAIGDRNYLGDSYGNFAQSKNTTYQDPLGNPNAPTTSEGIPSRANNWFLNNFQQWQADNARKVLETNGASLMPDDPSGVLAMTGNLPDTQLTFDQANTYAKDIMDLEQGIAQRQKDRDNKYWGGDNGVYDDILNAENLSDLDKAKGQVSTKQAQARINNQNDQDLFSGDTSTYADAVRKEWNGQRGIIPSTEDMYNEWVASTYEPGTFGYANFWDFSGPESNAQDWYDFAKWSRENYGAYSDAEPYFDSLENFEQGWFNPTKAKNNILDYFETGANADMFGTSYADIENAAKNIANLGLPLVSTDLSMGIAPEDAGYFDALTAQMALTAMGYGAQNPLSISQSDWNKMSDALTRVGASDVDYAGFDNNVYNYLSNDGMTAEDIADLYNTNLMDYGLWADNPEMLTYLANMLGQQAGYGNTYSLPEGMTSEDILNATFTNRSSRNADRV